MKADSRPVELFPAYSPPAVAPLTAQEGQTVDYFLLVREQIHAGPLYTQTRTWRAKSALPSSSSPSSSSPSAALPAHPGSSKAYGQDQINQQYGVRNKATVDPFTAVPMYSHRFQAAERALPDLAARPFSRELFPPELWPALDGEDGGRPSAAAGPAATKGQGRGRVLALSDVTLRTTQEAVFGREKPGSGAAAGVDDSATGTHKALEQLEKFKNVGLDSDDNVEFGLVEDEGDYDEVEDEEYDDDEEGDYNAEAAFDNGDNDDYGDDFGDDGGGGGGGGGGDEGMY